MKFLKKNMVEIFLIVVIALATVALGVYGIKEKRKAEEKDEQYKLKDSVYKEELNKKSDEIREMSEQIFQLNNRLHDLSMKTIDDLIYLKMSVPEKISVGFVILKI